MCNTDEEDVLVDAVVGSTHNYKSENMDIVHLTTYLFLIPINVCFVYQTSLYNHHSILEPKSKHLIYSILPFK